MKWKFVLKSIVVFAVVIFVAGAGLSRIASPTEAQEGPLALGGGSAGQTSFEFVAKIAQNNADLNVFGYLTYVKGTTVDALFVEGTNPIERSENEAYLTFMATGSLYSRSVLQPIFNTNSNLTMTIYYNAVPGATFDDPASFADGEAVATLTVRLHTILNAQATDVGIAMVSGESSQSESPTFSFLGQDAQFGQAGMTRRFSVFGQGFRRSLEPLVVELFVAGDAVVIE